MTDKRKGLKSYAALLAFQQVGRFRQGGTERVKAPAPKVPVAHLAELAGNRGAATDPMDNGRRAENYRRQRGGLAPTLTDRQRRRLRKNQTPGPIRTIDRAGHQ